ncbi:hypothetical protein RRG08_057524 [Elysia crispata]|uniref:Uncharacterized protein n=1 Tax=Elysia crispata TaxID=231223 RepID=A0AAE0ZD75_9GAST|nr:hypothetical protein RRG08_057524 [Elysia crispata]
MEVLGPSRQPPGTPQRAKKTIWNLTSMVKSTIKGKIKSSKEYAQVIKGLVTPKTPEKRSALQKIGVTCTKEAEKEPAMQL